MNTPNTNRFDDQDATQFREEWLSAYLDDELGPAQREIVEQRIAVDAETTLMLRDLERIRGLVGSLPRWSGRSLQVPVDGLPSHTDSGDNTTAAVAPQVPTSADPLAESQQPDTKQPEADFHDELQSPSEQLSPPAAAASPSAQAPANAWANSRSSPGSWWRPLALAASLLFAVGLGVMLWTEAVPWSVATRSRFDDMRTEQDVPESAAPADADAAAESAPPSAATAEPSSAADSGIESQNLPTGSAAAAALKDSPNRAAERSSDFSGRGEALRPAPAADPAPAAESSRGGEQMLRSGSLPSVENRRDLAPPPQSLEALSLPGSKVTSDDNTAGMGGASPSTAKSLQPQLGQLQTLGTTAAAKPTLQLARSTAWQESEFNAGLARLAPLLNLSRGEQASSQPAPQASTADRHAHVPVAVASFPPEPAGSGQLAELLQQSSVNLTGIAVTPDEASNLTEVVPYGTNSSPTPSTVALFVNRGQAEQILQAAQQTGLLKAPPVWIRSAADSQAPLNDDQQVIVVLAPQ